MSIRIIRPGLFTTVQDMGRTGFRSIGVPSGGAADLFAMRAANLLAGNLQSEAALEITLMGPQLLFESETVIALWGADFEASLNGDRIMVGRPYLLQPGSRLTIGGARVGCRAYLAVSGGIDVPPVLGSRSTYVRAGIGGYEGRALQAGDRLQTGPLPAGAGRLLQANPSGPLPVVLSSSLRTWTYSRSTDPVVIRVVRGKEAGLFPEGAAERFFSEIYTVRPESDRMGIRLAGGPVRQGAAFRGMRSEPVSPGTVQIPPDGQPILLATDCQTIGGYPRMAHAVSADDGLIAQLRPGDRVRFTEIGLLEAERLLLERELRLARLEAALRELYGSLGVKR